MLPTVIELTTQQEAQYLETFRRQGVAFPDERLAMVKIQAEQRDLSGMNLFYEAVENGIVSPGDVEAMEVSRTRRCPLKCINCFDSADNTQAQIAAGLMPRKENKATLPKFKSIIKTGYDFGIKHIMHIGGTLDYLPELPDLMEYTIGLGSDAVVAFFTDGIPQLNRPTGQPSKLLKENIRHGWLTHPQTRIHVSMDRPYGFESSELRNLMADDTPVPNGESESMDSRTLKSQSSAVFAKRLIELGAARVTVNTVIFPNNLHTVLDVYQQVCQLQDYASKIGSKTRMNWTWSDLIWRAYQARGDDPSEYPRSRSIGIEHMPTYNEIIRTIWNDTTDRIARGEPRIAANSAGFFALHAVDDSMYHDLVVNQGILYPDGKPLVVDVSPAGNWGWDPMFPQLLQIKRMTTLYGYSDRPFRKDHNPYVHYVPEGTNWFPNIVTT